MPHCFAPWWFRGAGASVATVAWLSAEVVSVSWGATLCGGRARGATGQASFWWGYIWGYIPKCHP